MGKISRNGVSVGTQTRSLSKLEMLLDVKGFTVMESMQSTFQHQMLTQGDFQLIKG